MPAHAAITPLSVHSCGGGNISCRGCGGAAVKEGVMVLSSTVAVSVVEASVVVVVVVVLPEAD